MRAHMCVHTYTHTTWTHMHLHIFFFPSCSSLHCLASFGQCCPSTWRYVPAPFQFTKPLIGIHYKGPCLLWLLLLLGSLLGNAPAKRNGTTDFMCVYLLVLISGFWEPELCNKSLFYFPTEPGAVPKTHLLIKISPTPKGGEEEGWVTGSIGYGSRWPGQGAGCTYNRNSLNKCCPRDSSVWLLSHKDAKTSTKSSNPHKRYCPPNALV